MFQKLGTTVLSMLGLLVWAPGCGTDVPSEPLFVGGETDGDGDVDGDVDGDGDTDGDADGDGDTCTGEVYPCGPYGHRPCELIADERFIAASDAAHDAAGGDGILSLSDLYADDSIVGLLLFGTAGWCSACETEGRWLNEVYHDFENVDGRGGRIEFVAVVFQDDMANPATADYAEAYGQRHHFEFPVVADTQGDVLYYFDAQSTPGNILIDATEMRIYRVFQGFDSAGISGALRALDGSVSCHL